MVVPMIETAGKVLTLLFVLFISACFLYLAAAGSFWQWNNPKANQTTFWSEMPAPLRFERMAKYQ